MSRRRRHKLTTATFECTIRSLSHEGRGIGQARESKTAFIHGALPDEKVSLKLTGAHKKFDYGEIIEVLDNPHPARVAPPCPHYTLCGGCSLQHITPQFQLQHKQAVLAEQLEHFGKVTPQTWLAPLTGPLWQYRHKARLGVRDVTKKEKVLVGFRERNNRFLAELTSCPVLHPSLGEKLTAIARMIESLSIRKEVAQIEAAVGEDAVALILRHLAPIPDEDMRVLRQFAEAQGYWLYLQPKGPDTIHKVYPDDGVDFLTYQIPQEKLTFDFHPSDFTQVNPAINEQMVARALDLLALKEDETILDLFCGIGNFTLPLARHTRHVVGVEGSSTAVERAKYNAAKNHIENTDFFVSNLFETPIIGPWVKPYDKLLLDPPRSGAEAIVQHIELFKPQRIVYVSCNPATLARDVGTLVNEKGYTLDQCGVMDMFPHTSHVESIAVLNTT